MATNYAGSATEAPVLQSAAPILEGAASVAPSYSMIDDIFSTLSGGLQAKAQARSSSVVAEFIKGQGLIADALDQGSIKTSAEARSKSRKLFMDTLDANPTLAIELMQAQAAFMGLPGGGDIIRDGTETEQEWDAARGGLIEAGLIRPGATDEEVQSAFTDAQRIAGLKREHEIKMATLDERLKVLQVGSAERAAVEEEKRTAASSFAKQVAPSELTRMSNLFQDIIEDPNTSAAEKQEAIETAWAEFLSASTDMGMELGSDARSVFMLPFETLKDDFLKRATGERTDAELKSSLDRIINQQKLLLIEQAPELARLNALSSLINSDAFLEVIAQGAMSPVLNKIANYMATSSPLADDSIQFSPLTPTPEDRKAMKAILTGVNVGWKTGDPTQQEEAVARASRILSSMPDYRSLISKDPKSIIEIVNWLATSDFQKMVAANPDLLDQTQAAHEALAQNYNDEVIGMIERQFTENHVTVTVKRPDGMPTRSTKEVSATDLVQVTTTPLGVQFAPIDPKNGVAVEKAAQLNKDLKPIINTQVRAFAHLDGRTDYGAYWDEMASTYFGADAGSDEGDDLSPDDFRELSVLTSEYQPIQALVDKTEGGGNYDTLLGHSQEEGGEFEGVQVSKMTIAEAVAFSNGDYAQFSKDKVGRKATPMGRYQIVGQTLASVAREMGLPGDTLFDQTTQDAIFAHLVKRAIGSATTLKGKRAALREEWEGFKNASNAELDAAIEYFEG